MDWITADLIDAINETSWVDGIGTIVVLLLGYAGYKWIKNKFTKPTEIIEHISKILTKRNAPLRDDITCIVVSGHTK